MKIQLGEGRKVKKVLIVDDDPDFAKLLRDVVIDTWPEWEVRVTVDVFNTGRALQEFLPDLILLDLNLPGLDGYQICASIRKDPVLKAAKVISISSHDTQENRNKILGCGADFFFAKPLDIEKFVAKVTELFGLEEPGKIDSEKHIEEPHA